MLSRVSVLGLLAALGCNTSGAAPSAPVEVASGGSSSSSEVCSDVPQPGPSPLRRLSRFEYGNTVYDLLGFASLPASAFPPEELGNGFGNDATALGASQLLIEGYWLVAQSAASGATSSEQLESTLGCDPAGADALGCVSDFIGRFAQRAYRRPLEAGESERLQALFESRLLDGSLAEAIADVVSVVLQSPQFLYRLELDRAALADTRIAPLSSYEMASRLSYLFWGSLPDEELLELAANDELQTPEQVKAQAQRLLNDDKAHRVVQHFHTNLFGLAGLAFLSKSPTSLPEFFPELGPLFRRETDTFLEHVVWQGDGKLSTILSGSYTFMNARLAAFYGLAGPSGDDFERVELDPAERAGFLTQGGPMAALTPGASTNPVIRGSYVRSRLLCDPPPDPPANLMVQEPAADPELTTRERFAQHRTDTACSGCHRLIDPLGLPFENFDGLGQWRTTDNGKTIDASGDLLDTDVAGPVANAAELMRRLAQSRQVGRCYADHWLSFAYGRGFAPEDTCMRERVDVAFAETEGDVQQLLVELTQTDAFLYRSVEAP